MSFTRVAAGVCGPAGFKSAGIASGVKGERPDLALLISDRPASVAGVFTTNAAAAAPVKLCRERIASGVSQGVVINSGCANACTGARGDADAAEVVEAAAAATGLNPADLLACSTGLIGSYLDVQKIKQGILQAAAALSEDDETAAGAILTTDSKPKRSSLAHSSGWRIGGMAKGAGMIAPNMATMLGFVTTDARVEAPVLQRILSEVADNTFNSITVDGDASTNDTVLAFANGASGVSPDLDEFVEAFDAVCRSLSEKIVADGEGATKFVRIKIEGAANEQDARRAARTVAESILVKTALYGEDANWGRVAAALGRSGARADFDLLTISMAGVVVLDRGTSAGPKMISRARRALKDPEITVRCNLASGDSSAEMLTTDLSEKYVQLNAAYE